MYHLGGASIAHDLVKHVGEWKLVVAEFVGLLANVSLRFQQKHAQEFANALDVLTKCRESVLIRQQTAFLAHFVVVLQCDQTSTTTTRL